MMKRLELKYLKHFIVSFLVSLVAIYLVIFCGAWKIFEIGDAILYELLAAFCFGMIFWIVYELTQALELKIKDLSARVAELEAELNE